MLYKHYEVINTFLHNQTNINATTIDGSSPLHWAAFSVLMDDVIKHLDNDADVKIMDNDN